MKNNQLSSVVGVSYITPVMFVMDIYNEGLLCQSALYDKANADYTLNDLGEI